MAYSQIKAAPQTDFILGLRTRVQRGDPDIPISDFERYTELVGLRGHQHLAEQWQEAKVKRVQRDLIAECTTPLLSLSDSSPPVSEQLQHRTNRLLAAILEKLQ